MDKPLFSIIIITFNQDSIIEQSLNSTLFQDYAPLELVICDDSSTDNTGEVCMQWLDLNKSCFEKATYHRNSKNLGILLNTLQGVRLSGGSLVKVLAGDDILAPGAINKVAGFFENHPGCSIVCGNVKGFSSEGAPSSADSSEPGPTTKMFFQLSAREQFGILASGNPVPSPGIFVRRPFFDNISSVDNKVNHIEDWSFWLIATSKGMRLNYSDFDAAYYRVKPIANQRSDLSIIFQKDILHIIDDIIKPNTALLSWIEKTTASINRMKISMSLKRRYFLAGFFNLSLTVFRFFVRFKLYRNPETRTFPNKGEVSGFSGKPE